MRRPSLSAALLLVVGTLSLDPSKRVVTKDGEGVTLTAKEFAILEALLQRLGAVLAARTARGVRVRTAACRLKSPMSAHSARLKPDSLGIVPCTVSTFWPARGPKATR